jgi:hypothetical protein
VWTGKKPRIKLFHIIGLVCYVHIPDSKRRTMDKKAIQGYLVSYDGDERYRIYINELHNVIISRDVVFQEKLKNCKEYVELPMSDVHSPTEERNREAEQQDKTACETESEAEDQ